MATSVQGSMLLPMAGNGGTQQAHLLNHSSSVGASRLQVFETYVLATQKLWIFKKLFQEVEGGRNYRKVDFNQIQGILSNNQYYLKARWTSFRNGEQFRGTWVVQSVEDPTLAQVMISQFMSSSPASGSVLTAQSLEPALDSVSPPVSAPPPLRLCLFLSLSKIK